MEPTHRCATRHHYPQAVDNKCSLSHRKIQQWLEARGVYFYDPHSLIDVCEVFLHINGKLFVKVAEKDRKKFHDPMDVLWDGDEGENVIVMTTHKLKRNGLVKETNICAEAEESFSVDKFLEMVKDGSITQTGEVHPVGMPH